MAHGLRLYEVLPNLRFPQAVFTNIPYTYTGAKSPNLDEIIATIIKNEQKKISLCCYHLLSDPIINALLKKHKKEVAIEIVTNKDQGNGRDANKTITQLIKSGIPVLAPQNDNYEQMHHKFFIFECNTFDKCLTITGSYNPTPHGNRSSWDDIVILEGNNIAASYQQQFEIVKKRSKPVKC